MKIFILIGIVMLNIQHFPIRALSEESNKELNNFITNANTFCSHRKKLSLCTPELLDFMTILKIQELEETEKLKKEQKRLRHLELKKKEEEKRLKELEKENKILELLKKDLSIGTKKKFFHRF